MNDPGTRWWARAACRTLAVALILAGATVPTESGKRGRKTDPFAGWRDGAAGYREALADSDVSNKPLIVYFHAPWCHFCRTVDRKILVDPAVAEELAGMIGVRVYGEDGDAEARLMSEFGTEVYPSIFVRYPAASEFRRVDVFDGEGKIVPPRRFLEALRELQPAGRAARGAG